MGCYFLLQGIFLTQGWKLHLLALVGRFFATEPPGKPFPLTTPPFNLAPFHSFNLGTVRGVLRRNVEEVFLRRKSVEGGYVKPLYSSLLQIHAYMKKYIQTTAKEYIYSQHVGHISYSEPELFDCKK